jgi:hypothetical protein
MFDQQDTAEVTRGVALEVDVTLNAKDAPDLDKWTALAEKCAAYADTCLKEAVDQKLQKLPLGYHFVVHGSNDGGKIVKPSTPEQLAAIKDRLKWSATIKGLSGNYSGE